MANFEIIVGSVLGASEYVADALHDSLLENGHQCQIHLQPDIQDIPTANYWIICTSTHGAGDLPDNIQNFAEQLNNTDVSQVKFAVVGLGDTSYDTFCFAAKQMQSILQNGSATILQEPIFIDVLEHAIPEEPAVEWLNSWLPEITL